MRWTRDFEELTSASTSSSGATDSTPQAFFANAVLMLSTIGGNTNAHRQMLMDETGSWDFEKEGIQHVFLPRTEPGSASEAVT